MSSQELGSSQSQGEEYSQSQGEDYSQSQGEEYASATSSQETQDDSDGDDDRTEGPGSPAQSGLGKEDSMDISDSDTDSQAPGFLDMPCSITPELLVEWLDIGRRIFSTTSDLPTEDHQYAIRLAFERIYGLSGKEAQTILIIFREEYLYSRRRRSTEELCELVQDLWKDTFADVVS